MEAPKERSVRDCMPELYAWLEGLREAFGREGINQQLARAVAGEPTAWLSENGFEVGVRGPDGVPLSRADHHGNGKSK